MAGGWAGDKREVKADRRRKPCNCGAMSNLGIYVRPTNKCACVFCKTSDIPGHQADQTNLTGLGVRVSSDLLNVGLCLSLQSNAFLTDWSIPPQRGRLKNKSKLKCAYIPCVKTACSLLVCCCNKWPSGSTLPRPSVPQKTILGSDHFSYCFRYIQQINWTFSLPKIRLAGRQIDGMFWVRL